MADELTVDDVGDVLEPAEAKPPRIPFLESAIEAVLVVTILAQLFIVVLNVVLRSFFHYSFVWANETAAVALTILAFLGGALAYYRRLHMSVAVLTNRLAPQWQDFLHAGNDWLVAGIAGLILYAGIPVVANHIHERSPMLGVSTFWFVLPMPIGMLILIVLAFVRLSHRRRRSAVLAGAAVALLLAVVIASHPLWAGFRPADASLYTGIGMFFLATFLALPVGFSLALGTIAYLFVGNFGSFVGLPSMMLSGVDLFVLLALPFFILAGLVMEKGGISLRLVLFIDTLVGHLRGGLLHVTILSMYIVSGMSGSKAADVAAVGSVMCNILKKEGYSSGEGVAVLATSAVMGETVPPSIAMLVLASITSLSVAALFVAGIIPAAVVGVCLMVMAYISARRSGIVPKRRASLAAMGRGFVRAILPLLMPLILFGGIILGIATPTEVSSFAVAYGVLLAMLAYRAIDARGLARMIADSATVAGMILFILAAASAFSWALSAAQLPQRLVATIEGWHGDQALFMLASIVTLVVLGSLLEGLPALLILAPLLLPLAAKLGISQLHYGIVLLIAMGIGAFLPPLGVGFYVACAVARTQIGPATKAMMPYAAVLMVGLLIVAFFPWFTLSLPYAFNLGH